MITTLNQIRSHSPCIEGWTKLLKHLGKATADDEPLSLLTVLDSNGLDDAIWCLRTEATPERIQRFALAVARRVEHLHPQAKATLDIVERYLRGTATKAELDSVRAAACAATYATAYAAAHAAAAAYAAAHAAAADAAAAAAHAAAAADAAAAAAYAAADAAYAAAEHEAQVQIFKGIFA
jgi:hypothetical protein